MLVTAVHGVVLDISLQANLWVENDEIPLKEEPRITVSGSTSYEIIMVLYCKLPVVIHAQHYLD